MCVFGRFRLRSWIGLFKLALEYSLFVHELLIAILLGYPLTLIHPKGISLFEVEQRTRVPPLPNHGVEAAATDETRRGLPKAGCWRASSAHRLHHLFMVRHHVLLLLRIVHSLDNNWLFSCRIHDLAFD